MQPTRYSDSNSFKAQVIQECAQSSEMELDTDQLPALVDDLAGRIPLSSSPTRYNFNLGRRLNSRKRAANTPTELQH